MAVEDSKHLRSPIAVEATVAEAMAVELLTEVTEEVVQAIEDKAVIEGEAAIEVMLLQLCSCGFTKCSCFSTLTDNRQDGQINQSSQIVHALEDKFFEDSLEASLKRLSVKNLATAPQRPAYGTQGKRVTLWANYFELLPSKTAPFNRYGISFIAQGKGGEEPKGKKRERLTQLLLAELPTNVPLATDYKSTILTTKSLGFTQREFLITYFSEIETGAPANAPKFRAMVQYTGTITFESLIDYLSSTDMTTEQPATREEIIQATNIVLGHAMKANPNVITKRNKYFPDGGNLVESWLLTGGLRAFRGFFMSIRACTGRILLNVQVQHITAWEALSLPELIAKFKADNISPDEANRMISGLWVQVTYLRNRLKKVAGFATVMDGRGSPNPARVPRLGADAKQVQFFRGNPTPATYVSVADHFKQVHNLTLKQPDLPVINFGTRRDPMYIPAEMCIVQNHQSYDKKLSPDATAAMIRKAVRPAPENARTIVTNGIGLLKQNSEKVLNGFGIRVNPSMITVNARVLAGVNPLYKGVIQQPRDGSWNVKSIQFSKGAKLKSWSFLWIRTRVQGGRFSSMDEVTNCVTNFHSMLVTCGMTAPHPNPGLELKLNNPQDPGPEIEAAFARAKQFSLLLVILPNTSPAIYNAVKIASDIKFGIHTVHVVADSKKFAKALDQDNSQYTANVALKFNLKFGGENQSLRNTDLGFISEGKTMLVGLDVTHPSPGSAPNAPSVSSIVASIDGRLGQWPADVAIQTGRKEIVEDLKEMFKSRLKLWQNRNKQLPEAIIVYRDGVGETMYDLVRAEELPLIKEACRELYPPASTKADKPYITVIICGKRHHTRFYPTKEAEADPRTGGTKPGTVVDRGVTESRIWDFYLQAHAALQGTPKPCHYIVVHDEIFRRRAVAAAASSKDGLTAGQRAQNDLERLTHSMCYMFGRATKAVSLCPPAYYADLVCDRARRWLSRVFDERTVATGSSGEGGGVRPEDIRVHPNLKDTMFYI